jgi:malonyl-CoA O-methyltransferase
MSDHHIDKRWVRASFSRAAPDYDEAAILQKQVGQRMLERLDFIRLQPGLVLDIGCGTGSGLFALKKRYKKSRVLGMDFAEGMIQQVRCRTRLPWQRPLLTVADIEALPIAPDSIDLLFSNLTLQWCSDLPRVFSGIFNTLRPDGLFLFSTLGPDTLHELRSSWSEVDDRPHVIQFPDMHNVGDALVGAGFADVVMDIERVTMTYDSPREAIESLRAIGAVNRDAGRTRGLLGPGQWKRMLNAYEQFRQEDGRYPVTYEVVFGHALRSRNASAGPDGVVTVPLSGLWPSK